MKQFPVHAPPAGWRPAFPRCCAALLSALACTGVPAEEALSPILVTGEADESQAPWFDSDPDSPSTVYRVGREGIELFGGKGGSNPYSMISRLPAVQVHGTDAWGLVNQQGGNKGLRVRGEMATHGANGTVEGMPLNGPGPGPGYLFLLDAENIAGVSLAQGPVAPDRFSLYDSSGQLDTRILWPKAEAGGVVSLGVGEEDFRRRFVRLDTGRLASDTALFVSASRTGADKWRGSGQSPKRRDTFAMGLTQGLGALDMKFFAAHNEMAADNYKGLSYEQSKDQSLYDEIDYDESPTGKGAAALANWQGYNRQAFKTTAAFAEFDYALGADTHLVFKPFYSKEDGEYLYASGNVVRKWRIDQKTYGAIAELHTRLAGTGLTFGYGWVSSEPPAPATRWKDYTPNAAGGLTFSRWSMLADVDHRHDLHNLFAVAERDFGALNVKAGVRYVRDVLPSIKYYDPAGVGDLSYEDALDRSRGEVASRSVDSSTIEEWAPYLALRYRLSPMIELRASAGRNLGTPAFDSFHSPVVSGVSKQQLWSDSEMEVADGIDLAVRFNFARGYLEPLLFYTRYRNKGVSLYDPEYKASYTQNIADARRFGLVLAGGWEALPGLNLFGNLSWIRAEFEDDLQTGANTTLETEGEQLPDVPRRMATLGAAWTHGRFTLSPVLHYMGRRYANVEHTQTMAAYSVTNLDLAYRVPVSRGRLQANLAVINLFDKRYIGFNNANETNNGSSFFPGAPRTLMAKLAYEF